MDLRDWKLLRTALTLFRNSPWLMIALGLHVIVAAVMSVRYMRHESEKPPEAVLAVTLAAPAPAPVELPAPSPEPDRNKIPEAQRVELVTEAEVNAFLPTEVPDAAIDWHDPLGDPTGTSEESSSTGGTSIGVGKGGYHGTGVPSGLLGKRGRENRSGIGTPAGNRRPVVTDEAVLEGLRWLLRHQNDDGSWSVATLHEHCSEPACIPPDASLDASFDVGMTALALLAFLGHGIAPGAQVDIVDRAMGRPPRSAGDALKEGLRWLIARQKPDGSFSDSAPFALPENDTLPTMALCEAYGLAPHNREIRLHAQQALDYLVAAQKRDATGAPSGWGVGAQADIDARRARGALDDEAWAEESAAVDLSITCWVVMALKSAQSCGFDVPDEALAGALDYAVDATGADAQGPEAQAGAARADEYDFHAGRRASLGMLIRTFAGGSIDDPYLASAAREIATDVPRVSKDGRSIDFYYWYFATLALNQYDGPDSPRTGRDKGASWKPWSAGLVASLPGLQDRIEKRDVCSRGGWLQEARGNRRGRALYNTALNVLTLEVDYRYANVFGTAARERRGARGK
jgi:hypothetical protein